MEKYCYFIPFNETIIRASVKIDGSHILISNYCILENRAAIGEDVMGLGFFLKVACYIFHNLLKGRPGCESISTCKWIVSNDSRNGVRQFESFKDLNYVEMVIEENDAKTWITNMTFFKAEPGDISRVNIEPLVQRVTSVPPAETVWIQHHDPFAFDLTGIKLEIKANYTRKIVILSQSINGDGLMLSDIYSTAANYIYWNYLPDMDIEDIYWFEKYFEYDYYDQVVFNRQTQFFLNQITWKSRYTSERIKELISS